MYRKNLTLLLTALISLSFITPSITSAKIPKHYYNHTRKKDSDHKSKHSRHEKDKAKKDQGHKRKVNAINAYKKRTGHNFYKTKEPDDSQVKLTP